MYAALEGTMSKIKCSCSGLNGDCPICGDGILEPLKKTPTSNYVPTKKKVLSTSTFNLREFAKRIERDAPKKIVPTTRVRTGPTPTKRRLSSANYAIRQSL